MPLQALKMSPADQAFDRIAAEIALDVTAGLKHLRLHSLGARSFACDFAMHLGHGLQVVEHC